MIRFALHCDKAHEFDGWFRNNDDFDQQRANGLLSCPLCASLKIDKLLMAPAVSTSRQREQVGTGLDEEQRKALMQMREMAKNIRKNADYVGDNFAEEARRIHFGEVDPRAIYGEASIEDVSALVEDGVEVLPLPTLPEDEN
ncbi:DUF1178 family protein [Bartonella sp. LJL80]